MASPSTASQVSRWGSTIGGEVAVDVVDGVDARRDRGHGRLAGPPVQVGDGRRLVLGGAADLHQS